MIERYSREEMSCIWKPENRFNKWLLVEILACEAQAELGNIPKEAVKNIKEKAAFDISRIDEIEQTVRHDVISFLTSVAEFVGEDARYIHLGMTSSDVLDTGLALQIKDAADLILKDMEILLDVLKKKAFLSKEYVTIGRSHGVHAEPTTFGLKCALWYDEIRRNMERIKQAKKSVSYGQISGPVGTFSNIDPFVEEYVCKKCGLTPAPISNQVIQRDRHAEFVGALALTASSIDKIATQVRLLQHTELLEAEEAFAKGQKGSSAMPHKKNPIISERLSGLARVIRSNHIAAMENIVLWHERDISHSSVERIILPDSTILLDYMLNKVTGLVKDLKLYPENMTQNLDMTKGLIYSQKIMLDLVRTGITREDAYRMVQKEAMKVWEHGGNFEDYIKESKDIMSYLRPEQIEDAFNLSYYTRNVEMIFKRVFSEET